jgi:hypothetical protein
MEGGLRLPGLSRVVLSRCISSGRWVVSIVCELGRFIGRVLPWPPRQMLEVKVLLKP